MIGTQNDMKLKAGKLTSIRENIEHLIRSIPLIEKELCSNRDVVDVLNFIVSRYELNYLKEDVSQLKYYAKKLGGNLESLKMGVEILGGHLSIIELHREALRDIYGEIDNRKRQLMGFPLGTLSNGPTSNCQTRERDSTVNSCLKEVIKNLREIQIKIIGLMTCFSEVECYVDRTKGKLECFVKSLETKVVNINGNIKEVESSIESVIICFLKCSNESITNNTIKSTKRLLTSGGQVYNKELARPLIRCLENVGCQYNI